MPRRLKPPHDFSVYSKLTGTTAFGREAFFLRAMRGENIQDLILEASKISPISRYQMELAMREIMNSIVDTYPNFPIVQRLQLLMPEWRQSGEQILQMLKLGEHGLFWMKLEEGLPSIEFTRRPKGNVLPKETRIRDRKPNTVQDMARSRGKQIATLLRKDPDLNWSQIAQQFRCTPSTAKLNYTTYLKWEKTQKARSKEEHHGTAS